MRRSRLEVVLLGPLVTVLAVLTRHLAVPVALVSWNAARRTESGTIPVGMATTLARG